MACVCRRQSRYTQEPSFVSITNLPFSVNTHLRRPNLRSVCASRARLPVTVFFFAALRNLLAAMGFPFFAPNALRKAPGFLIAF